MSNPPGYAQPPPYIYWCINEITRDAPCKVEKLTNLAWMAIWQKFFMVLANIQFGCKTWPLGDWRLWQKWQMAKTVKTGQQWQIQWKNTRGLRGLFWQRWHIWQKWQIWRTPTKVLAKIQMKWQRSLLKERGDFDKKKWKWLIWRKFVKALTTCQIGWHRGPLKSGDFGENGKNGERGENFSNSPN